MHISRHHGPCSWEYNIKRLAQNRKSLPRSNMKEKIVKTYPAKDAFYHQRIIVYKMKCSEKNKLPMYGYYII